MEVNKEKLLLEAINEIIKDIVKDTDMTYIDIYKMLYYQYYDLRKETN